MDKKKQTFAMNALRRASYKWVGRWTAEKKYKHPGRNQYWCSVCGPEVIYSKKETQMDHTEAVIDPIRGFTTMDEWIDRLLVYEEGWTRMCIKHHKEKTLVENNIRAEIRLKKTKKNTTKKTTKKKPKR